MTSQWQRIRTKVIVLHRLQVIEWVSPPKSDLKADNDGLTTRAISTLA